MAKEPLPLIKLVNRLNDGIAGRVLKKTKLTPLVRTGYRTAVAIVISDEIEFLINGTSVQLGQQSFVEARTLEAFSDEIPVVEDLCEKINPSDVYWDIGAHVGAHSCAVNKTNPEVQVLAFEPVPTTADQILENASLNGVEIEVHRVALSNSDGKNTMDVEANISASGQNSLSTTEEGDLTVETAQADSLLDRGLEQPTVLKIDVEGAEGLVLEGASSVLSKARLVYCELHPDRMDDFGYTPHDVRQQFSELGFDVVEIHRRRDEVFIRCER